MAVPTGGAHSHASSIVFSVFCIVSFVSISLVIIISEHTVATAVVNGGQSMWMTHGPREQRRWRGICAACACQMRQPPAGRRPASGQCLKHHIQLLTCKRVLPCESMGVAGEARARVLRACRVRGGRVCSCARRREASAGVAVRRQRSGDPVRTSIVRRERVRARCTRARCTRSHSGMRTFCNAKTYFCTRSHFEMRNGRDLRTAGLQPGHWGPLQKYDRTSRQISRAISERPGCSHTREHDGRTTRAATPKAHHKNASSCFALATLSQAGRGTTCSRSTLRDIALTERHS